MKKRRIVKKKILLSAFVVVRNEEKRIEKCIKNLQFCDEIIIIDQQSTDNTIKIAKKQNCKIYTDKCWGHCEPSRIIGTKKSKGKWILNIDADEKITTKLKKEIKETITKNEKDCYYIHRNLKFMGKTLKNLGKKDWVLRLHKKGKVNYTKKMHEAPKPTTTAKIGHLKNSIDQENITIHRFVKKSKYFAPTEARNHKKNKSIIRILFGIIYMPIFYFSYKYFVNKGFLDGKEGLIYSYLVAYYQFQVQKHVWLKFKQFN